MSGRITDNKCCLSITESIRDARSTIIRDQSKIGNSKVLRGPMVMFMSRQHPAGNAMLIFFFYLSGQNDLICLYDYNPEHQT